MALAVVHARVLGPHKQRTPSGDAIATVQGSPLRAGRNFAEHLNYLLTQRFATTVEVASPDDKDIFVLRNWMQTSVFNPAQVAPINALFVPKAISQKG
jgi:hypothetical protein